MRIGLVGKIFIATTLLLLVFFVFQLYFQNTYIDTIYSSTKLNTIRENLEDFIDDFTEMDDPNWQINYLTSQYAKKNNAPILVVTENNEILNDNFFREFNILTLDLGKGNNVKIIVDFLDNFADFSFTDLKYGEKIQIQGKHLGNSDFMEPTAVGIQDFVYANRESKLDSTPDDSPLAVYSGYIRYMQSVNRAHQEFNYTSHILYETLLNPLSSKDPVENTFEANRERIVVQNWSNSYYVILSDKAMLGDEHVYIFTLHRLDKVAFAFSALNPYYILMYVICLIFMLIIAFAYSKWLTKPLLRLNNMAKRIAKLDFTPQPTVHSKDELGELSDSLQILSKNLEQTISNLEETNEQLASEAAMRAENEKRIRYLMSNLSHEFKTPLSIISGFVDVLSLKAHDKDPNYYYTVIQDEIDNLNHLILETVELSKQDSGYYHLDYAFFDVASLLDKVSMAFEKHLVENRQTLVKDIMSVPVHADRGKIEQVLINFVSNAIKYTAKGGSITIRTEDYGEDEVIIKIENEGRIPEEDLDNIWKRYYRANKNEKISYRSSGIGLEIAKNILDLHSSTYGVKNLNDRIQFYFTLSRAHLQIGQEVVD